jgi:hypothetical protein
VTDDAELDRMAEDVRDLYERGSSDDEVAAWLKTRTASFGESGKVLARATGVPTVDAYRVLHATETWKSATTRFRIVDPAGRRTEFNSPDGKTFGVGDAINLPIGSEPPYEPEPGRGTVWRVVAVETEEEPGFNSRLVVEPVRRLEPRS